MTKRNNDVESTAATMDNAKRTCAMVLDAGICMSIQTAYEVAEQGQNVRGFVELSVVDKVENTPLPMTYIAVLDKSSSMLDGQRAINTTKGFRALNALVTGSKLIAIPFNHEVDRTFGPMEAPLDGYTMSALMGCLEPHGGTDIALALGMAYDLAAQTEGPVTILLLTDGCDNDLKRELHNTRNKLFGKMAAAHNVFLCLVGICHDADAYLLGKLAQLGNGTYTVTPDKDIAGLMGSMVALSKERVHVPFELTFPLAWKAPKQVYLSRTQPTRVAFCVLPCPALSEVVLECCVSSSQNLVKCTTSKTLAVVPRGAVGTMDMECIRLALDDLCAQHKEKLAEVPDGQWTLDITNEALEALAALKLEFASALPLPEADAMETELLQTRTDIETARRNASVARALSHRIASNASTVRNSGMSVGAGSHETPTQANMRSLSSAMTF
jgi:hypothetical protein